MANGFVLLLIINTSDTTKKFKKRLERQTLYTGCSKAEPKNFTPPQTALPRAQEGQNLVSWRWSPLPDIARVQSLKVLGVTISSSLSLSEHVNSVISSCACSQYAIKVLRAHGLCDTASQEVYKSFVVGKLLYASLLGGGLHQQQTGSVWKQYFAAACVLVCIHHSKLLTE